MKILIVSNLYPPIVFGGYEILCHQVVNRLRQRGHDVSILTSTFRGDEQSENGQVERSLRLTTSFPIPGEDVGYVDFRLPTMNRVARQNFKITSDKLQKDRPDILFCWCMNRLSLGPVFAAQEQGIPVCYTINDEHPKQFRSVRDPKSLRSRVRSLAEQWWWPMATLKRLKPLSMTVISQALKDSLLEQGTAVEDAQVIYQGVPLEGFHFKPLPRKSQETCRILYAGQLSNAKGVHTLLKAASILVRDPSINFEISIVGSGVPEYETELRGIVQTGGLTGRVRFLGKRPHSELARIYNEHHVFVFPSEWKEPFGLTHLEAMASGCAVVSTTRGGTRELVRDGDNALAFEAGDAEDLVKKLMKLIRNENRRMAMIGRARTWLEKHHSMDFYVENLEEFLSSSLRN